MTLFGLSFTIITLALDVSSSITISATMNSGKEWVYNTAGEKVFLQIVIDRAIVACFFGKTQFLLIIQVVFVFVLK
jgi:hypothetical protein